jgi:hypothetical protein
MRPVIVALVLALGVGSARAEPRTARNVRATGITLTVMGMVQLTAMFGFGALLASPPEGHYNDSELAAVVGLPMTTVTGVTFLAAGIPLWVRGGRDLRLGIDRPAAPRRTSPRGNRATGITLTVMGIVNAALIGAFIPLALSPGDHEEGVIGRGVGYGGIGACAGLASVFLSVGIPLWVIGSRDLERQRSVALAPNGLVGRF